MWILLLRRLAEILLPSVLLLPVPLLYLNFEGTPHFFLHTFVGQQLQTLQEILPEVEMQGVVVLISID